MDNQTENADSQNGEEITNSTNGEPSLEVVLKEKNELSDKNKQLFERTKKAESELKELREKLKSTEASKDTQSQPVADVEKLQTLELKVAGVTHDEDIAWIKSEAKSTGKTVDELLGFNYVREKLETSRTQREAQAGMPGGNNRAGGNHKGTVEYYLEKGGLPDDQDLAEKVVEARMGKDDSQRKFNPIQ